MRSPSDLPPSLGPKRECMFLHNLYSRLRKRMGAQIVRFVVVTSSLRNLAPTNGFNNIFHFDDFQKNTFFFLVLNIIFKFSFKLPARMPDCRPQIDKNPQQQNPMICQNPRSRSRGVAILSFGLPMLHGDRFFCDPHAAWERQKCIRRHLPSENSFFYIFSPPPQREAQQS